MNMARMLKNTTQIKELGTKIQQDNIPKMIQMDKLIEHEDNEYLFGENDEDTIKNLAEGIKKEGFNGAILVWDMRNGTYKCDGISWKGRDLLFRLQVS